MFADVAVNATGARTTFHYHLPPELVGKIEPGMLVTVPFADRRAQGLVVALIGQPAVADTRAVESIIDPRPVLTPPQLALAAWLAEETLSPLVDCLTLMLPPGLSQRADYLYVLNGDSGQADRPTERRLMELLARRGPLRGRQLQRALPHRAWKAPADSLVRRGLLQRIPVLDPPRVKPRQVRTARLIRPPGDIGAAFEKLGRQPAAGRRRAILEVLLRERSPLEVSWIYAESGGNASDLRHLADQGLILISEAEVWRDPLALTEYLPSEPPTLTQQQAAVWTELHQHLESGGAGRKPFLLQGVTGSGKTEIYLRAVGWALSRRKSAIVLVPEIALTPQSVRRFLARFPGQVGLIHSQLSPGERYDTWRRCRDGDLSVLVGPRSALFAPLADLGLIVVDESHDESYKEEQRPPRYHARETAIAYAAMCGGVCLLGSATPDLVTRYRSEQDGWPHYSLPRRILGHRRRLADQARRLGVESHFQPLEADADAADPPPVRLVDMRQELRAGNRSLLSRALQQAIAQVLARGEQAILFLNRRGSATYVFCRDCGYAFRCPRCETPLVLHADEGLLRCHHCGYQRKPLAACPQCGGQRVRRFGAGTQTVEDEVRSLFPAARTLRWDQDTARAKGSHEIILAHFIAHRADVLIGTQMLAKGLDLPLVTLVGAILADSGLTLPDYRAAERTFQILTQVAGRAGRSLLGGRVILQSYMIEHYSLQAAASHDYEQFYAHELKQRRRLNYPPFTRLARMVYRHTTERMAEVEAQRMADHIRADLQPDQEAALIGPVPCFYRRLRGLFRWQIILRAPDPRPWIPADLPDGWSLDIDPVDLL
jgi:primosomal protein N' (replication factor Y) (superfamily II helicase)